MSTTLPSAHTVTTSLEGDDERSLLIRLELLLEREEELLASHDAEGLLAVAEERERVTLQLGDAAQARRKTMHPHTSVEGGESRAAEDAELIALYQRLRHRHDVRARVMRRHGERNARAMGVLAQAGNQASLYGADGRVPAQWTAA